MTFDQFIDLNNAARRKLSKKSNNLHIEILRVSSEESPFGYGYTVEYTDYLYPLTSTAYAWDIIDMVGFRYIDNPFTLECCFHSR
jgi:hypothetical protein